MQESNSSPMVQHIQELELRIEKLERQVSELVDKIAEIANNYYREINYPILINR